MKATKETLEQEIKYRIELLEKELKHWSEQPRDESNLYWFVSNEHSMLSEINRLIDFFGRKNLYEEIEKTKYTPICCERTDVPLLIGDFVHDNVNHRGTLFFDKYTKQYVIKTEGGGHVPTRTFIKINKKTIKDENN